MALPPESSERTRKRDQLKTFLHSRMISIKQEVKSYYIQPSPHPTRSVSATSLGLAETQELDAIPEIAQPYCIVFPTYGCQLVEEKKRKYKITMAGWAFAKPQSTRLDRFLLLAGRAYGGFSKNSDVDNHFSSLLNQFRCQTLRMTDINLTLPRLIAQTITKDDLNTAEQKEALQDYKELVNTGQTGRFQKEIVLDADNIQIGRFLNVEATFTNNDQSFPGYIDIIEPHGISVISDIDDTIKVTNILDGKDAILHNTFFRTATEVPDMSKVYRSWAAKGAHFHYVSNSPWQVYPAISEFLVTCQFPKGSIHLRTVSAQQLIRGKPGRHKIEMIKRIIEDFPNRKFVLVGDSGEIDPEIYQEIYNAYPDQVIKIFIHDVSSQRAIVSDRTAREKPDSYYRTFRKFLSQDSEMLRREGTSSQFAIDAMAETEVPEQQQQISDPNIPILTKLEQFEERMEQVSAKMREGVFTKFTLASQLMLDHHITEEFSRCNTGLQ